MKSTAKNKLIMHALLLVFLALPEQVQPISPPEGLRGVAQTYGAWLDELLENNPLQIFFRKKSMTAYRQFNRQLLIAERLMEDNEPAMAYSYLKKASFLLEDIDREVSLGYKRSTMEDALVLNKNDFDKLKADEKEDIAAFCIQKSYLHLQYEYYHYYFDNDFVKSRAYFTRAKQWYQKTPSDTGVYDQFKRTDLPAYIETLDQTYAMLKDKIDIVKIAGLWDQKAKQLSDKNNLGEYWAQKTYKRAFYYLAGSGYVKDAYDMIAFLDKNKMDIIPFRTRLSVFLYNGMFNEVKAILKNRLEVINLSRQENWADYIEYSNSFWNLLLMENSGDLENFAEAYMTRLETFLSERYLPSDIHEYISNEIYKYRIRLEFLRLSRLQKSAATETKPKETLKLNEDTLTPANRDLYSLYLQTLTPAQNTRNAGLLYLYFTRALRENSGQAEQWLEALKKNRAGVYFSAASLQYAIYGPVKTYKENTWLELWKSLAHDLAFQAPNSFLLKDSLIPNDNIAHFFTDFLGGKGRNLGIQTKLEISRLVDFYSNWKSHAMYPPNYYNDFDQRLRYQYLAAFEFALPKNAQLWVNPPEFKFETASACNAGEICWNVITLNEFIYSALWEKESPDGKMRLIHEQLIPAAPVFETLNGFYAELEKKADTQKAVYSLAQISEAFKEPLKALSDRGAGEIRLNLYQGAHMIPFEAMSLNDGYLSGIYTVTRKIPTDVLANNYHCIENCPANYSNKNHVFLGVGSNKSRFIMGVMEQGDEVIELENLFTVKSMYFDKNQLARQIIQSLLNPQNKILHIAGGWSAEPVNPALLLAGESIDFRLSQLMLKAVLPYVVMSMQKMNSFNLASPVWFTDILETFRYKNTNVLILSLAPTPKPFRQAFFYNMYYRIEHKGDAWKEAFRSSVLRTQKGFTNDIWPYLMVFYEK